MTILLIEDEPLIARQLQKLVSQLEPEAMIDGPLGSVQGICDYFSSRTMNRPAPDLVIADIQLSDGVSFDAFRQVGPRCSGYLHDGLRRIRHPGPSN